MNSKLYVGQLPFSVSSDELGAHFSGVGEVVSAKVITHRDSGKSKGFGFVEMANEQDAQKAIEQLNGKDFKGRTINVSIAKPQEEQRRPRTGGGGGRGGFGGGGNRGGGFRRGAGDRY